MSVRITCPQCGIRPLQEWVYGEILQPPVELTDPDEVAFDRGFMHTNTEGEVDEAWFHLYGCRRWVKIRRDTRTDQIVE